MSNIDMSQAITAEDRRITRQTGLAEQLAELRYTHENADVELPGEVLIQGSREARQELATQHMLRQTGVAEGPLYWKGPNGWITLSADMLGLALWEISNRIQACFQAEQLVIERIKADELAVFSDVEGAFLTALNG